MSEQHLTPLERATAIAERDQLHPLPCTRRDTSELIWLVQSRSDPSRYYLLTVSGDEVSCACPQAQQHGVCAHVAAVRMALQTQQQPNVTPTSPTQRPSAAPQAIRPDVRSASQRDQERRQRAEAERRERAILWTDDQPFSIWK